MRHPLQTDSDGASTLAVLGDRGSSIFSRHFHIFRRYGMLMILLLLVLVFLVSSPAFRTTNNLINLVQQNSIYGIVACGMLFMIIAGGFDLSVGSVAAMAGVVAAYLFTTLPAYSIPIGVAGGLAAGLAAGFLNGVLIAKIGINPFIATLGTQILIRGLLFIATDARPIYGLPIEYTVVGLGKIGPIPVATLIFALVALGSYYVLRFTRFGHYVYSVGGSPVSSRLNGINVDRVTILAYVIGGGLAALGGLVLLGQTIIGQPAAAETWPLTIIAIVVIGGTPLTGGVGGVLSVVVGTFILGTIANALNLYNASPYWQPAITGLIVLMSVAMERYGARFEK